MESVSINFEVVGKKYSCRFTEVHGSGGGVWHLMDTDNFYLGRLRKANDKWVFDAPGKVSELKELADFFGDYLTAWYE